MVFVDGKMVRHILEIGSMTWNMVKACYGFQVVLRMTESSKMVASLGLVCTKLLKEQNMKECGNLTCKKEKEPRRGRMVQCTSAIITLVSFMDMEYTFRTTIAHIKVIGKRIKCLVKARFNGPMAVPTKALGSTIKCMVRGKWSGPTEESTSAALPTTSKKEMAN